MLSHSIFALGCLSALGLRGLQRRQIYCGKRSNTKVLLDIVCALMYIVIRLNSEVTEMPSENKRINLTVPDDVYVRIQKYRKDNAIMSDAAACMQLIMKQLQAEENSKMIIKTLKSLSPEQLQEISLLGMNEIRSMPFTEDED